MVALSARGSHDSRIGYWRAVISANRACKARRNAHDDHLRYLARFSDGGKLLAEHACNDRDKDTESTPGSACGESESHSHNEQYKRKQDTDGGGALNDTGNERSCLKLVCHGLERPRECKNEYRRHHLLKSGSNGIHALREPEHATDKVINDYHDQRAHRTERKPECSVAVRKCVHEIHAAEETACVDHADNAENYQNNDRQDKVDDLSPGADRLVVVLIDLVAGGKEVAIARVVLMALHGSEVHICGRHENNHHNGEQRIKIIGDSADEKAYAIHTVNRSADCSSPRRDRRDDAYRRRGCVDEVRKL